MESSLSCGSCVKGDISLCTGVGVWDMKEEEPRCVIGAGGGVCHSSPPWIRNVGKNKKGARCLRIELVVNELLSEYFT